MGIFEKLFMKQRTVFIVTRIIALSILLYALAEIIIIIMYCLGQKGYINLGIPITIVIGIGMWHIRNWARKLEIALSAITIGIGILTHAVPDQFSHISIYYLWTRESIFFSSRPLVIIGSVILLVEIVFLMLPSTIRLFHNAEHGELPKE